MKKSIVTVLLSLTVAILLSVGAAAKVVIDSCDTFVLNDESLWGGTNVEAVTAADAPEGSGYVKATPADGLMILTKAFDDTDVSAYPYLYLDLYLSDAASVTSGQLEITSSGRPDSDESSWEVISLKLKDGWNHLKLKISDANAEGGRFDSKKFNTFRIFAYTAKADAVLCVDRLGFGTADECKLVIDNCDRLGEESTATGNTWIGKGLYTVAEHGKEEVMEGEGCIYQTDSSTVILQCNSTDVFDLSAYEEEGYLMFWLYTGDVFGTLYTGQIELTSSGTSDSEELTWSMSVLKNKLQNGWNKVALPLSDAQKMSDADLSAINFFRIYDFVAIPEEPAEFRIDNVWVGTKEEALEEGFLTEEALTTPVTTEKPVSTGKPAQTTAQQTLPATQEGSAASAETSGTSSGSEGNIGPVVVISVVVIAAIVAAVILVRKKRGHGNG